MTKVSTWERNEFAKPFSEHSIFSALIPISLESLFGAVLRLLGVVETPYTEMGLVLNEDGFYR